MHHPSVGSSNLIASSSAASSTSLHLGVIRSRTLLFQSYRDSAPRKRSFPSLTDNDVSVGYSDANRSTVASKSTGAYYDLSGELQHNLPPRWVDTTDEVDAILTALQPRISHLDRLHARHILPGFTDRTHEEREIERETIEITKQFRQCSKLIALLAKETQTLAHSGQASMHELAMARNVQTTLATKVQDASGVFRRKQSNYMQRLRGHEERHHDVSVMANGTSRPSRDKYLPDSESAVREDVELVSMNLTFFFSAMQLMPMLPSLLC